MRTLWLAGLAVGIAGSVSAQSPPVVPAAAVSPVPELSGPMAAELKRMQGHWKPQSVVFDSVEQIPDPKAREKLTLWVEGSEFRTFYCRDVKADQHFRLFTADLNLDPTAHTFELTVRDGPKKGERRHGIYELNGKTMKLCYGPVDQPRPTTFAAPKGSGIFLETWAVEKR